jgi:SAM dependent carboxyl methyltransferase
VTEEMTSTPSAMEGKGAYNKYAKLPAGGAALALPFLEIAAQNVKIDLDGGPLVIADYGSSQGKNSLAPMQLAIRNFRRRIPESRPIVVYHIDQPTNDFNSLFEVLATDPDSYSLDETNVFPCAIGRSFYENVLPPESVHLGWSSYAAVWLSRIPTLIPGHFISLRGPSAVRNEFERQAAQDWKRFLSLRVSELLPGGRLVVALPAVADDGSTGFEGIMDHANAVLADMVENGAITADERSRMALRSHPRRKADLLAPFAADGQFQNLTVEAIDESVLTDSAWTEYERDSDSKALAKKHALFFRTIFMPSLAAALTRVREGNVEALSAFGNGLEEGLKRRLERQPAALHSFVHTIVLAKRSSS